MTKETRLLFFAVALCAVLQGVCILFLAARQPSIDKSPAVSQTPERLVETVGHLEETVRSLWQVALRMQSLTPALETRRSDSEGSEHEDTTAVSDSNQRQAGAEELQFSSELYSETRPLAGVYKNIDAVPEVAKTKILKNFADPEDARKVSLFFVRPAYYNNLVLHPPSNDEETLESAAEYLRFTEAIRVLEEGYASMYEVLGKYVEFESAHQAREYAETLPGKAGVLRKTISNTWIVIENSDLRQLPLYQELCQKRSAARAELREQGHMIIITGNEIEP